MCQQIALKRGTKGSRGDLQSAFALLLAKQTTAFLEAMGLWGCFFFPHLFLCFYLHGKVLVLLNRVSRMGLWHSRRAIELRWI